jgi:hypothetical protein
VHISTTLQSRQTFKYEDEDARAFFDLRQGVAGGERWCHSDCLYISNQRVYRIYAVHTHVKCTAWNAGMPDSFARAHSLSQIMLMQELPTRLKHDLRQCAPCRSAPTLPQVTDNALPSCAHGYIMEEWWGWATPPRSTRH